LDTVGNLNSHTGTAACQLCGWPIRCNGPAQLDNEHKIKHRKQDKAVHERLLRGKQAFAVQKVVLVGQTIQALGAVEPFRGLK